MKRLILALALLPNIAIAATPAEWPGYPQVTAGNGEIWDCPPVNDPSTGLPKMTFGPFTDRSGAVSVRNSDGQPVACTKETH